MLYPYDTIMESFRNCEHTEEMLTTKRFGFMYMVFQVCFLPDKDKMDIDFGSCVYGLVQESPCTPVWKEAEVASDNAPLRKKRKKEVVLLMGLRQSALINTSITK